MVFSNKLGADLILEKHAFIRLVSFVFSYGNL